MITEAIVETPKPARSSQAEAIQTSLQPKKLVKVRSGATLESTTLLSPANNPVAKIQPINAEKIPSSKNGSWIDQEDAPTNFITPVSRRRLNAAIRRVFEINRPAVNTEKRPTSRAPLRRTFRSLKNFSKMLR